MKRLDMQKITVIDMSNVVTNAFFEAWAVRAMQ